ncbi:ROK family transcriptional regulator [Streptomyces sp. WMMB 322]|uniref:ROK family transcriptional regulator n=1 Tax=Streptomyces sp. WMMB 322 TaxID=1286821 RepID=UPI0006E26F4F|nr:ROK family transcriptional regulator [Streptomyces sp. WMMB 322]SCK56664.1 Sugar kinase of the NBD/HSP70 family, may contain an N-terminal HTH domain [Streptomyces sp. WMMB 322]
MAVPPNSQQEMRQRNLSRVLYAVAYAAPVSRASIAARIGLTRASVSTLVEELLRAGFLVELGPGRSGGVGRPGNALALTGLGPCGIGAEIGVDHLTVCAVDLEGRVRVRAGDERPNGEAGAECVLRRLSSLRDRVVKEAGAAGLRPAGLAVAVPGLVTRSSTTVVRAPNLGWYDTDLAAHLAPAGAPLPLTVENEANFGALAELWLAGRNGESGESQARRDFIHVSAEVGIGAGVVLDGELLRGTRGFAGELGHVPVQPDGPRCACGGSGCLEQYAGEAALLRAAGIPVRGAGGRTAALARLRSRAEDGDEASLRALRRAGRALGIALTGAVNLLDPRAVLLGGALAGLAPWLLPPLERELRQRTASEDTVPEVAVSAIGSDGPSLGAAYSVVRAVLDDPLPYAVAH